MICLITLDVLIWGFGVVGTLLFDLLGCLIIVCWGLPEVFPLISTLLRCDLLDCICLLPDRGLQVLWFCCLVGIVWLDLGLTKFGCLFGVLCRFWIG